MQTIGEAMTGALSSLPPEIRERLRSTQQNSTGSAPPIDRCPTCHDVGWVSTGAGLEPCGCQRDAQIKAFRANSNVPGIYAAARFDDFNLALYDPTGAPVARKALSAARRYVEGFDEIKRRTNGRGLYFTSRTKGSGKTLLAAIIANELIDRAIRARFVGMPQMLSDIKRSYNAESGESEAQIIATATNAPVLVLDDLGAEKQSDWVNSIVYQLLDARIAAARPTIFTSNAPVSALLYDERVKNRIDKMAFVIDLPEDSVRAKTARLDDETMRAMIGETTKRLTGGNNQ